MFDIIVTRKGRFVAFSTGWRSLRLAKRHARRLFAAGWNAAIIWNSPITTWGADPTVILELERVGA